MVITESLARGLRANFWNLLETEVRAFNRRITEATEANFSLGNTKQQNRFLKSLDDASQSSAVMQKGVFGARKRPLWWCLYLSPDDRNFSGWEESCLRVDTHYIQLNPRDWNETWLTGLISEHCIARLFQRLPWVSTPSARSVFPELKELVTYMPWYDVFDELVTKCNPGKALSLFYPTMHGVFLGSHHPTDPGLNEIRTFVGKQQLTHRQMVLWQQLMTIRNNAPLIQHVGGILRSSPEERMDALEASTIAMTEWVSTMVSHQNLLTVELIEEHPSLQYGYVPSKHPSDI